MSEEYEDYYQYAVKERRNLVDILYDFKGIKIPLDLLVSYVGWLKPREYSIASSHRKDPLAIRLLVALVEYQTLTGRKRQDNLRPHRGYLQQALPVASCWKPRLLLSQERHSEFSD
jgi:hypothetical protein